VPLQLVTETIQYITQSKKLTAEQALKDSLVDEICSPEDIVKLAKTGLLLRIKEPWDNKEVPEPIGCWTNFGSH
jgi:3-hydroxyacyl-CoA dehydrogenase/enoyl-CoA hydratase/3-hydroxybutyryl-CoA epimerase